MQQRGTYSSSTLYLFELEFVAPRDHWPPDQLIDSNDNRNHRQQSPRNSSIVFSSGGSLQKRAQPRKPKIPRSQDEHLARHQEEPTAGHRYHWIPHQSD